jgi:hypothetical protein
VTEISRPHYTRNDVSSWVLTSLDEKLKFRWVRLTSRQRISHRPVVNLGMRPNSHSSLSLNLSIDDTPYSRKINRLMRVHLVAAVEDVSIAPLLKALGCRIPGDSWGVTQESQDPQHESMTRYALLQALNWHAGRNKPCEGNEYSILDGLLKNERWRDCLESAASAYALAVLLLRIAIDLEVDPYLDTNPEYTIAYADLAAAMHDLLTAWCQPSEPITKELRGGVITRALFGEALWELVLSDVRQEDWSISEYIAGTRPPFRPGLLPEHLNSVALTLPEMGR